MNSLTAGRSWWNILFVFLAIILWLVIVGAGTLDFISFLISLFPRQAIAFILAIVIAYFAIILFVSDLFLGHTLNIAQVSTDNRFLAALPIHPISLFCAKLLERLLIDWPGMLILLPAFITISIKVVSQWYGIFISIILYFQFSLLIGLCIIILSTALQRFLRPAALSNTFSLLAYVSSILGFIPIYWITSDPISAFFKIINWQLSQNAIINLLFAPFQWLANSLLMEKWHKNFLYWNTFWVICLVVGSIFFAVMNKLHWLGYTHHSIVKKSLSTSRWFFGIFRKEFLLLKSDFNILTNALFLPLTIICLEIWLLRETIAVFRTTGTLNIIAIAVMYFCMFGPMNSIGSEGKAIFLLETLPISPSQIIFKKALFWTFIAELFFLPASILVAYLMNLSFEEILQLFLMLLLLVPIFVFSAVCISAIFPNFHAKVLQGSSELSGKIIVGLLLLSTFPIKSFSIIGFRSMLVFSVIVFLAYKKAVKMLRFRLDTQEKLIKPKFDINDGLLILFSAMSVQNFITWIISFDTHELRFFKVLNGLAVFLIFLIFTFKYAYSKFLEPFRALGIITISAKNIFLSGILGIIYSMLGCFALSNNHELADFFSEVVYWSQSITSTLFDCKVAYKIAFVLIVFVFPIIEEIFFRGFLLQAGENVILNKPVLCIFIATLNFFIYPWTALPIIVTRSIINSWLFLTNRSIWNGLFVSTLSNSFFYLSCLPES